MKARPVTPTPTGPPMSLPSTSNCTFPGSGPAGDVSVAVSLTVAPAGAGLGEAESDVVVGCCG
jgi:hypothetical protein